MLASPLGSAEPVGRHTTDHAAGKGQCPWISETGTNILNEFGQLRCTGQIQPSICFYNKVLLEQSHIYLHTVWHCIPMTKAELESCDRGRVNHKSKRINQLALYRKEKCADPSSRAGPSTHFRWGPQQPRGPSKGRM